MAEYIEREGLINNRPEGRNPKQIGKEEYNKGWNDCRSAFYVLIEDMPAIDVAQVRHGRWIMTAYTTVSKRNRIISNKKFSCSECAYTNGRKKSNYCQNCGAKMDLEV